MFTNAMRDALISGLLNIFKDNIEAISKPSLPPSDIVKK